MVVGNGLIAKSFDKYNDDDRFLIFASGVSNSKSATQADYDREAHLLQQAIEQNESKQLVYFSTCSINDPAEQSSGYVIHKQIMEDYVQRYADRYAIFRVSNLVGRGGNPNTILNFFTSHIKGHIHFNLWQHTTRNLIDVADFFTIADHLLQYKLANDQIINIANPENYSVQHIVSLAERHYNIKADYTLISKGSNISIDIAAIKPLIDKLNISFGEHYLEDLLSKYY
jgi:nucleoside-diphosphate-sugar epimerase